MSNKPAYHEKLNQRLCVLCGFGVAGLLEKAHLDGNHSNNAPDSLAWLCPTCHRMHDVGLVSTNIVNQLRDEPQKLDWKLLPKDAQKKGHLTLKRRRAGKKAAETRMKKAGNAS